MLAILEEQLSMSKSSIIEYFDIDIGLLDKIPYYIIKKGTLLPINIRHKELTVFCSDNNNKWSSYLRFLYRCNVKFIKQDKELLNKLIDKLLESKNDINIKNENITMENIIEHGINEECSDIHIETLKDRGVIKYRKDGVIFKGYDIDRDKLALIIGKIKVYASMDIVEKSIPQDGKMVFKNNKEDYDLRVCSYPTVFGESVVIRIIYNNNKYLSLSSLGFRENSKLLKGVAKKKEGLLLFTGPTGSGKTSSIYSVLNEVYDESINIVTVEDPVEVVLEGINQISITNNLNFSNCLRNILRADPDVIMVGEIRDRETAQMAVEASITGHLVLSTLHINYSTDVVERLNNMGVEKYLVIDGVKAVVSQRLMRKLCNNCKEKVKLNEEAEKIFGNDVRWIFKEKGCEKCNFTGFSGRTLVSEVIVFKEEHRNFLKGNVGGKEFRKFCKTNSFRTIEEDALDLVKKGVTSLSEYERFWGYEDE